MHIDKMAMPFRKEDIEAACVSAAFYLGYDNLKDEQKSVITKFVSGSDVFAILPTGFGKVFVTLVRALVFLECLIVCWEWSIPQW